MSDDLYMYIDIHIYVYVQNHILNQVEYLAYLAILFRMICFLMYNLCVCISTIMQCLRIQGFFINPPIVVCSFSFVFSLIIILVNMNLHIESAG